MIHKFFTPGLAIYSYLIFDLESKIGILIDPTTHIEPYLAFASQHQILITEIVETHVHADFLSGAYVLKSALGHRPHIHCSAMGGSGWIPEYADHAVRDRDRIETGPFVLEARHTPGHTEEHLMWLLYDGLRDRKVPECCFTGDLLFSGSVGRPDLLGFEKQELLAHALYQTLFQRLQPLPDFLEVFPGHGAGSFCAKDIGAASQFTLGYERRCNPYLQPQVFEEWQLKLLQNIPTPPAYFLRMKQLNLRIFPDVNVEKVPPVIKISEVPMNEQTVLIDTRSTALFAASHVSRSINLPLSEMFPIWAGMVLQPDQDLYLVLHHTHQAETLHYVRQALRLIGLDHLKGVCLPDFTHAHEQLVSMQSIPLSYLEKNKEHYYLLDVRSPTEWHQGHLSGAHHLELAALPTALNRLPKQVPIALICRSGMRAGIAASFLMRHGFEQVVNVQGGMQSQ